MRIVCGIILVFLLVAVAVFAIRNGSTVTLTYFAGSISCPLVLLIGIVYLLGMLTGYAVLGLVSRSLRRVTARPLN